MGKFYGFDNIYPPKREKKGEKEREERKENGMMREKFHFSVEEKIT